MSSQDGKESTDLSAIDSRLCRMCLMAVIVFVFGKEALMFIQRSDSILIMGDLPEPCHKCGYRLQMNDCQKIMGVTHCICYNCGQEWVE